MNKQLFEYLKKPELYAQSTTKFWDDEHISKGMLESHLDPGWGASRPHEFMDRSVQWLAELAPPAVFQSVLDLGCGPGLYAERMYEKGYSITGVDFSKRSIAYAKDKASERQHKIQYIYQNYLEIDYQESFDLIILIYCDYAVLTEVQRAVLLKKVYQALKHGGKFIFDVFTPKQYEGITENNNWYFSERGGFWRPHDYLCLNSHYIYENNIHLDQHVIVEEDKVEVIRVWDHCFTRETIEIELKKAGFEKCQFYSDVTGAPYDEETKTMCMVAQK